MELERAIVNLIMATRPASLASQSVDDLLLLVGVALAAAVVTFLVIVIARQR